MPIYKDFFTNDTHILIWKYDEQDQFNARSLIEPENSERFNNYQPKKLLEALMVRRMLRQQLPESKIIYNADGEPILEPKDFEISISHTFPFAAIALSQHKIGIDLERIQEKIIRVKDKFIKPEEQTFIPEDQIVEYLTVIWSIKESLYKIHHSNYWSLKKHYEVKPFSLNDSEIRCRVYDEHFSDNFTAKFWRFEDMAFTLVK